MGANIIKKIENNSFCLIFLFYKFFQITLYMKFCSTKNSE